jgi:hypothetical protein
MTTTRRALVLISLALPATVVVAGGQAQGAAVAQADSVLSTPQTPSAATFAADLVGVTNRYSEQHGTADALSDVHCVQAAPGRYMCSYVSTRNGTPTCHLMQARWTPKRSSTITVTLAGRTARCATLRDALRSLH